MSRDRRRHAWVVAMVGWLVTVSGMSPAVRAGDGPVDPRDIRSGSKIPDEGYCDQPYVVVTADGNWLCTLTTGPGREGEKGQHVASTISADKGKTWSKLVDLEPADGPAASWVMPLIVPGGRVYAFYVYNGDRIDTLRDKKGIRADTLGWYVYRWSDDDGRTWSKQRKRLPLRVTACDLANDWSGVVQMFWGIGKPIIAGDGAMFAFSKIGKYPLDDSEGWFLRSDNILAEGDVDRVSWQMLPVGPAGMRAPDLGSVQEEHNVVALSETDLYCMYRTTTGYPAHAYSRDGGKSWTTPEPATYTPGGKKIKNPRACARIWRTSQGNFLLWYHNHSGRDFTHRNPAWISGGVVKDGHIHWSQPEIVLYGADPKMRMSYPDLIEQDGRYWIAETQKSVARVHEIDPTLLQGMWEQGNAREVTEEGAALALDDDGVKAKRAAMPKLADLRKGGGFSLDLRLTLDNPAQGRQVILDSRNEAGKGLVLTATEQGTIRLDLNDGQHTGSRDCEPGLISAGKTHHLVVTVDGGPKIITFVVDGVVCDGGSHRQFGWGRFSAELGDVNGSPEVSLAPSLAGELAALRVYDRPLRNAEAVGNYQAWERTLETPAERDRRMAWWREARFGMFIHWGLYAVPAGEWKDKTDHAEWIMDTGQIPVDQYEKFAGQFNPVKFDAEQWVQLAKRAGMRYIVITSKHHDGFGLFDSEVTDYDVMSTPFKRDILRELADACRQHGLEICWYHSIMDWHHPDYLPRRKWEKRSAEGADFDRYVAYMKSQLRELLTNYGRIGVLWFDGEWEDTWTHGYGQPLYDYVRGLQPDIIINNRVDKGRKGMEGLNKPGKFSGDFGTPEQQIPATGLPGVDWETCMTMNDHWGYNKNDQNFKSAKDLIRKLADIASKGGNFLLNVGPTAEGLIPGPSVERLEAMGRWMEVNDVSIYGTEASPFEQLPWGRCTRTALPPDKTRLYLHVFNWPANGKLVVPGLKNEPVNAFLLAKPELLEVVREEGGVRISVPPDPPDKIDSVVVLTIEGEPEVVAGAEK